MRVGGVVLGLMWALARRRWASAPRRGVPEALLLLGLVLLIATAVSPGASRALGPCLALACWLGLWPTDPEPTRPGWAVVWQWPLAATALLWSVALAWRTAWTPT